MSANNDGGPAYPAHDLAEGICNSSHHGMTMRQAYKIAALQGLLSSGMLNTKPRGMEMGEMCDGIISTAAQFADALLAEDAAHASCNPTT